MPTVKVPGVMRLYGLEELVAAMAAPPPAAVSAPTATVAAHAIFAMWRNVFLTVMLPLLRM